HQAETVQQHMHHLVRQRRTDGPAMSTEAYDQNDEQHRPTRQFATTRIFQRKERRSEARPVGP
ncbi:hypothetical protein, partial [Streptomyces sp. BE230]|uniref:hypothetical protein n=1 Tax=Streptomyces sp. BE230 TaxID=3002526 RepID=UPI002ED53B61|nr:hypothetical protein [Streptomyces sp. BE230]